MSHNVQPDPHRHESLIEGSDHQDKDEYEMPCHSVFGFYQKPA